MRDLLSLHILVVEDDPFIADDIARLVMGFGHTICGVAGSFNEAVDHCMTHQPSLVLIDIHLTRKDEGIELAEWVRDKLPVPIIFLTAYSDQETLLKAKAVHPDHYLIKPFNDVQLKIAIEIAADNFYNPDHDQQLVQKLLRFNALLTEPLSKREADVVRLLDDGLTNQQIADRLFVSENTVKTHLKNIFLKASALSRTELLSKFNQC